MTMLFRTYTEAIGDLLEANQGTDFITVGYGARSKDASEYLGNNRTVEVVYKASSFPKASSGRASGINNMMSWSIVLTVSNAAEGDLAALEDSGSTPTELATAIAGLKLAEHAADESMNELFDIVFQILMSATNRDLGLSSPVANTWLDDFQKDDVGRIGELVVLKGKATFSAQGKEEITGDTGVTGESVEVKMQTDEDGDQKSDVYIQY